MEKPGSILAAVLLSLAMPGLGHLYCGRWLWALLIWPLQFFGIGIFVLGWAVGDWPLRAAFLASIGVWTLVEIGAAGHAGWMARKQGPQYRLRGFNLWYFYLLIWIAGMVLPNWGLYRAVRANLLGTFQLSSDAMTPTLLPGDLVMVDRRTVALGGLQRGDVVAMVDPLDLETVRILRVAGIGGDRIELGPDGLLVNQAAAPRKELGPGTLEHQAQSGEWTSVATLRSETAIGERTFEILEAPDPAARRTKILSAGPDQLVLLGDNRLLAVDSFSFGPVERAALIGKAFLILGSKDPRTRQWRPERKGLPLP